MRSLSADKCISDKRAAERLVSLRIPTEWVFFFFQKQQKKNPILRCCWATGNTTALPPERGQLHCWEYWQCWATGRTGKISEQRHVSRGAGSWSSLLLTPQRGTTSSRKSAVPRRARSVSTCSRAKRVLWKFWKEVPGRISAVPHHTRGYCEKGTAKRSARCCLQVWT